MNNLETNRISFTEDAQLYDFSSIENNSLRHYLEKVSKILPDEQEKFHADEISLIAECEIETEEEPMIVHFSELTAFLTKQKIAKIVEFETEIENGRPRNKYTKKGFVATAVMFWTYKTNPGSIKNLWTRLTQTAQANLGGHPLGESIFEPDPSRRFTGHVTRSKRSS